MPRLPFPNLIRTVLFDFDGTLMDASSAICRAFHAALGVGGPTITEDRIRVMIGRPLRDMFLTVLPQATQEEVDELVNRYREVFLPLSMTDTQPLPGARDVVESLRTAMHLGIVTTRMSDGALRMLEVHGMLDAFDCVIGLEQVDRAKPDPQPVLRALERIGTPAGQAVMVGDTPDDILAGLAAGTGTVGVTSGAHDRSTLEAAGAHFVIATLSELPPLLTS